MGGARERELHRIKPLLLPPERRLPRPDLLRARAPSNPNSGRRAPTARTSSSPPRRNCGRLTPAWSTSTTPASAAASHSRRGARRLRRRSLPVPARRRPSSAPRPPPPSRGRATRRNRKPNAAAKARDGWCAKAGPAASKSTAKAPNAKPTASGGQGDEASDDRTYRDLPRRAEHRRRRGPGLLPRPGQLRPQQLRRHLHQRRRHDRHPGGIPSLRDDDPVGDQRRRRRPARRAATQPLHRADPRPGRRHHRLPALQHPRLPRDRRGIGGERLPARHRGRHLRHRDQHSRLLVLGPGLQPRAPARGAACASASGRWS